MTPLQKLHADEGLRNHEFPVTAKTRFFGHSSTVAFPRRVAQAMQEYIAFHLDEWQADNSPISAQCPTGTLARVAEIRRLAATFVGAKPEEIALVGPTAWGLGLIAESFPWQVGDHVLIQEYDFPTNVLPWWGLERRG